MCVEFAKKGCKIVGVDISPAGLLTTEELMKSKGFSSSWHCYKCDISKRSNVYETADMVGHFFVFLRFNIISFLIN